MLQSQGILADVHRWRQKKSDSIELSETMAMTMQSRWAAVGEAHSYQVPLTALGPGKWRSLCSMCCCYYQRPRMCRCQKLADPSERMASTDQPP